MLSGNGRHRRPRQAPALVVAAGVTGSAIAIPLLGAGTASADQGPWDRLAQCETGGDWAADKGNDYYGGLQLSEDEWEANGGLDLAPRADMATPAQQIQVGQRILAAQGPSAWPGCALSAGLTAEDGSTTSTTVPQDAPSAEDTDQARQDKKDGKTDPSAPESADPSASSTPDATDTPTPDASASPSDEDGTKAEDGTGSKADATGKSRARHAKPDPSDASDGSAGPAAPSGSAAAPGADPADETSATSGAGRDSGADRSAPGGRHAAPDAAGQKGADGADKADVYKVREGDNLWSIAEEHEVPGGWTGLYEQNKKIVGDDPDLILPGQSLDLGADSGQ
ncbi:transglycosylase family protein [Streptomyces sp. SPB074]|uniref:LysM peptidoglycan-binding domain-containing protein n=1 Tax=Streptomyces sp. (strain SPB074) TaxID=465543 RepID=UPI00017F23D1|nr:transglycosylase family protein [Streptomyces sp. SPB074]EDY42775.1 vegetative cell wall protein gp1 [Streptomyces sp. SPB074]